MKVLVLIGTLGALLITALVYAVEVWTALDGVEIGFHGWLAMALGVSLSFAVGGGLMALVFYSSRSGHDDDHHYDE
ncbi:MAG: hypothetical protein AAGF19_09160 [Pseudomonadota bacterium]